MIRAILTVMIASVFASTSPAQTEQAYDVGDSSSISGGLLDPSRLSVRHQLSFGMGGSSVNSLKSQSLYTTMLQYTFGAPLTLNLNFGFPLHSTLDNRMNLNSSNLQSAEYFRTMPLDFALTWQPRPNMMMQLRFERYQNSNLAQPTIPFEDDRIFNSWY